MNNLNINNKLNLGNLGAILLTISNFTTANTLNEYNNLKENKVNIIHTVTIKYNGNCCSVAYVNTKLGNTADSKCVYSTETNKQQVNRCGPSYILSLNGTILGNNPISKGKDCAATVISTALGTEIGRDEYKLIYGTNNQLVSTQPTSGEITWGTACGNF